MKKNNYYIVAGCRPWNRRTFEDTISSYPGEWVFVNNREKLAAATERQEPKYIFFLHWNWIVPESLLSIFPCVCFHMADVPYARGGSPLQNLIVRGHRATKLTALKMVNEMDAGPVYLKRDLSIEGNAEEIYIRASALSAEMIRFIITENPQPVEQTGEVVEFPRRKPAQSVIAGQDNLLGVYDHIRMLDAEGYPAAFLDHDGFRYTFRRAGFYDGRVEADVTIVPLPGDTV
ncbi:MAG: methionyl-tRNA formyltransferase [Proteobacteria bacterium]|nr:methionyl-tRNA formyltransferase [Pseudomonadota bacterium]MBU1687945.1 methionyl-tRNA formyltransferase [Pseudomonadota bacterium]